MGQRCCRPAPRCWPATETRRDFDPDGAVRRLNASRAIIGGERNRGETAQITLHESVRTQLSGAGGLHNRKLGKRFSPGSFLTGGAASLSGTFPFPIRRLRAGQRRFKVRLPHYRGSEASETPHPSGEASLLPISFPSGTGRPIPLCLFSLSGFRGVAEAASLPECGLQPAACSAARRPRGKGQAPAQGVAPAPRDLSMNRTRSAPEFRPFSVRWHRQRVMVLALKVNH